MATLNPQTEAKAFAQRLIDDALDDVEARASVFFAIQTLHGILIDVQRDAEEQKAALVLQARAAAAGQTIDSLKADVALALGKHPTAVTASEVVDSVSFIGAK